MKKLLLVTLSTVALIGCSSSSNSDELNALSERVAELEELNSDLDSERSQLRRNLNAANQEILELKSELNATTTPKPTVVPVERFSNADFNPQCSIDYILDNGARIILRVTNPFPQRQYAYLDYDVYVKGQWVKSGLKITSDIPSGQSASIGTLTAIENGSSRKSDYRCEITEVEWRES